MEHIYYNNGDYMLIIVRKHDWDAAVNAVEPRLQDEDLPVAMVNAVSKLC